jgi:hypothetical protein
VESQPCAESRTARTLPAPGAPAVEKPKEQTMPSIPNSVWIAIGVVAVLIVYLFARGKPQSAPESRGPVLTSQLPPPTGGVPHIPGVPLPPPGVQPHAFLVGTGGEYNGLRLDLGGRPIILGRDPKAANLVFANDTVSDIHCAVSYEVKRGVFVIQDLGSASGTHLATGHRLVPNVLCELGPGGQFSVGDLSNRFQVVTEIEG